MARAISPTVSRERKRRPSIRPAMPPAALLESARHVQARRRPAPAAGRKSGRWPPTTASVSSGDRQVQTRVLQLRKFGGREPQQQFHPRICHGDSRRAAGEEQQGRLGEQLPHHAAAPRAQRRADRQFLPALGGMRGAACRRYWRSRSEE